jgi:hypothetical protein
VVLVGTGFGGLMILGAVLVFGPSENVWLETKRMLEARGEELEWDEVIPPKVAAEENLFEDEVAASLLPLKGKPTPANPLKVGAPVIPPGVSELGVPFVMAKLKDLPRESATSNEVSLVELHDWFAKWDESFVRLREAGQRPKARLPGDYTTPWEAPMPNFVAARQLAQSIASRAKVHLCLGESAAAFEDMETLRVVMGSFEAQPGTLVMAMIHVAVAGLYLETIEEGFREKLWKEAELRKLRVRLQDMNLLAVVEQGIRGERVGVLRTLEALAVRKRDPIYERSLDALTTDEWTKERIVFQFAPSGWVRHSQAKYAELIQGYLDAIDASARRVDLRQIEVVNSEVQEMLSRWSPKNALLGYVTPNFSKAAATVARNQSRADQLAVACALEVYRLRNGEYVDALERLVPEYIGTIPKDVYSGRPVGFRRVGNGFEILVSQPEMEHPNIRSNFMWQGN